jgi:hypothetical protein
VWLPLAAFVMVLLFAAGLNDAFPALGKVGNLVVLVAGAGAAAWLGDALLAELWRGSEATPLVRRAASLKLVELAQLLARDLDPEPSSVPELVLPVLGAAACVYALGMIGVYRWLFRLVRRRPKAAPTT